MVHCLAQLSTVLGQGLNMSTGAAQASAAKPFTYRKGKETDDFYASENIVSATEQYVASPTELPHVHSNRASRFGGIFMSSSGFQSNGREQSGGSDQSGEKEQHGGVDLAHGNGQPGSGQNNPHER